MSEVVQGTRRVTGQADQNLDLRVDASGRLEFSASSNYETVATSQTDQMLGSTGAIGDEIEGLLVVPATTSPGSVVVKDGATSITVFVGGASSIGSVIPFYIPLNLKSTLAGWSVTTGANLSVIATGRFT